MMYGLVTAIALIVVGLILYLTDLSFESWSQWVTYAVFLVGIIMNATAFSKANDHYVTFGNVFSSGFKASAIITLIMIAWGFIMMAIFPEMKEKGMEMARESMEKRGSTEEQIEQGMEMTRNYFTVFMVGGILFGYMFFGAIFSLIGAAIAKKKGELPPATV